MNIIYYENNTSVRNLTQDKPTIFLAGPTPRPHQSHIESWRKEALKLFEELKFDGNIVIPEFKDSKSGNDIDDKDFFPKWEYQFLVKSDIILFWVCRTEELIGLTTNHELGYWMGRERDKVVYGRPEGSYKTHYDDIMWVEDAKRYPEIKTVKIFKTLKKTIEEAIEKCQ
jgi:nucleoside 2-deoxyribosyltransferase